MEGQGAAVSQGSSPELPSGLCRDTRHFCLRLMWQMAQDVWIIPMGSLHPWDGSFKSNLDFLFFSLNKQSLCLLSPGQPMESLQTNMTLPGGPWAAHIYFVIEQLLALEGFSILLTKYSSWDAWLCFPGRFTSGNPPPAGAQWLGALQGEQQAGKTNIILLEHISTEAWI